MKVSVHGIGTTPWEVKDGSITRLSSLRTSIGRRDQSISISYHRGAAGALHCLLMLHFDFELVSDPNANDQWCLVTLIASDHEEACAPFRYGLGKGQSSLTTDDPSTHKPFFAAFLQGECSLAVSARKDILWEFPVPFDESIKEAFTVTNRFLDAH